MFSNGVVTSLISSGCDRLTATRNPDGTFLLEAFVKVKQSFGEEVDAVVEFDRVLLNIEALVGSKDNQNDICRLTIPRDDLDTECFPEPTQEELELLGLNSSQTQILTEEDCEK